MKKLIIIMLIVFSGCSPQLDISDCQKENLGKIIAVKYFQGGWGAQNKTQIVTEKGSVLFSQHITNIPFGVDGVFYECDRNDYFSWKTSSIYYHIR